MITQRREILLIMPEKSTSAARLFGRFYDKKKKQTTCEGFLATFDLNSKASDRGFIIFKGQYHRDMLVNVLVNVCVAYPNRTIEWEVRRYDEVRNRPEFEEAL